MAETETVQAAAEAAAKLVTGPDTPEAVHVTQHKDRLTLWMDNLAAPAVSFMVAGIVLILSFGGLKTLGLWTATTEAIRVHYVGGIGALLAVVIGLVLLAKNNARPNRIDLKAGPASLLIADSVKDDAAA